jgi:hypothetical protein
VVTTEEIFESISEDVVRKQITNMCTPCVVNVICKSKITNMATVRNFEVISDMFNIGVHVIYTSVITSSKIENNPQKQWRTINLGNRKMGFLISAYCSVLV